MIDRRDPMAKEMLLRFAASTTSNLTATMPSAGYVSNGHRELLASDSPRKQRWLEIATQRDLPPSDFEPLKLDGDSLDFVWRSHYVAAIFGDISPLVKAALEDRGFVIVSFDDDETRWEIGFGTLESALGR